jgi:hypothetical protein
MKMNEILKKYYVERTCYEDYFNLRRRCDETIIMSGSKREINGLIKCWLNDK